MTDERRMRREHNTVAADLILTNGHILTMNPAQPTAEAVAIRNGIVAAVGSNADALAERRPGTEVVDLAGRTATPAFNDAHCHPMNVGFTAAAINARAEATPRIADLVDKVRARANGQPRDRWIIARGYDDARFAERRHPEPHRPRRRRARNARVRDARLRARRGGELARPRPRRRHGSDD